MRRRLIKRTVTVIVSRRRDAERSWQVTLDRERLEQLSFFQRGVNHLIIPMSQRPDAPWQDDATFGDCKEYVLAKCDRLLDAGWPASALLFAIALLANGEGHLVLVVVTDQGDLVLDNLQDHVVRWDGLPYTWLKRSSPANPFYWQTIVPGREPSEAATSYGGSRSRSERVSWHRQD
jgi:predicted transglutaminase-like cysteine proteinase